MFNIMGTIVHLTSDIRPNTQMHINVGIIQFRYGMISCNAKTVQTVVTTLSIHFG